jgi:ABC-type sugar transport system substrate-binding protein
VHAAVGDEAGIEDPRAAQSCQKAAGNDQGVGAILKHAGMNAEVAQHLKKVGYVSVTTLAKALEGQSVPAVTDTGTTLVTSDNASQYLTQAKADAK